VGVSAVPVGPTPEGERLMTRWVVLPVLKTLLRNVYTDLAEMESLPAKQWNRLDRRAPTPAGR
jgi:hypothetical protein